MRTSRLTILGIAILCLPSQALIAQQTEYHCKGLWAVDMKFDGEWGDGWSPKDPPLTPHEFNFDLDISAGTLCRGGTCEKFKRTEGQKIIIFANCWSEDSCRIEDFDTSSGDYRLIMLLANEDRGIREITFAKCED